MRRCGKLVLHDPHDDCDGRTTNAPMVGQVTVGELREALAGEPDWALVAVKIHDVLHALRLVDRPKGTAVFLLEPWQAE